jgi:hypothetical protein
MRQRHPEKLKSFDSFKLDVKHTGPILTGGGPFGTRRDCPVGSSPRHRQQRQPAARGTTLAGLPGPPGWSVAMALGLRQGEARRLAWDDLENTYGQREGFLA